MMNSYNPIIQNTYISLLNNLLNDKSNKKQKHYQVIVSGNTTYKAQLKQSRNELCACGSGKKYKNCCGR